MNSAQKLFFTIYLLLAGAIMPLRAQETLTVWPGDANNNGRVNNLDFLQLGLAYNFFGPERNMVGTDWMGVPATPWAYSYANGVNFAHADCNGDGLINFLYDAFPIYVHYGNTRPPIQPDIFLTGTAGIDPVLALGNSDSITLVGSAVQIPLVLGTAQLPVDNFYGLAFTVHFDAALAAHIGQVQIDLSPASWVNNDNDRIYADFPVSAVRRDAAITRTDRNARNGHGSIGTLGFIIIDDLVGFQGRYQIWTDSIKMLDPFGNETMVAGDTIVVNIGNEEPVGTKVPEKKSDQIQIQPNPMQDNILFLQSESVMERLECYSTTGQLMATTSPASNQIQWTLPNLSPGTYMLRITTRTGIYVRMVVRTSDE